MTKVATTPAKIEQELEETWKTTPQVDEVKAALFNLVVHVPDPSKLNYAKRVCHLVTHKFPCRVLLLVDDPNSRTDYLKTEVEVDFIGDPGRLVSCDKVEFQYAGTEREKIPFLILPHLVPDLPVYLLWMGSLDSHRELFNFMIPYAHRVIVDPQDVSQVAKILPHFPAGMADLNWSLLHGWRQAIASAFNSPDRLTELSHLRDLRIHYASHETTFQRDPAMQALYLQGWLGSQMGWAFLSSKQTQDVCTITYQHTSGPLEVQLVPEHRPDHALGSILSMEATSYDEWRFDFSKDRVGNFLRFRMWTPERCEIPRTLFLPQTDREQALAREIFQSGTSDHYRQMIDMVAKL